MENNLKDLNGASEGNKTFDDFLKEGDYQAEFDKRMAKGINTALETERGKMQQEIDKKLSELTTQFQADEEEKLKLQEMKEIDQVKYHYDKQTQALQDALKENNAYKLRDKALELTKDEDARLRDFINKTFDFNNIQESDLEEKIQATTTNWKKSLEDMTNEHFKEPTPKEVKSNGEPETFDFKFTGVRPRPE